MMVLLTHQNKATKPKENVMFSIITKDKSAYFAGFTKTGKVRTTKVASKAWKDSLQMAKVQARMLDGFQFKPVAL